ncbi:MAG: endonuclease/exonuclease/phosphatase family protein [Clostridia bacterium]|nr:endonuclease/exonuclease/phosphatase family protein [Clostridia bacterium]
MKTLLSAVSYNLRAWNDGENKMIGDRAPRLQAVMYDRDPDLMGFQEVRPVWMKYLTLYFGNEYDHEIMYRDSAGLNSESTPIFWKKKKFQRLDGGSFWLSETPDQESKGWGADYYRVCTWVRLKCRETGEEFLYYNTHYDGPSCHCGSNRLVLAHMREQGGFAGCPVLYTGDFNMTPESEGYRDLLASGELKDLNCLLEASAAITTDGYNENNGGRIIDFCYCSEQVIPSKYQILNQKILGGYVSDHRGLYIEAELT